MSPQLLSMNPLQLRSRLGAVARPLLPMVAIAAGVVFAMQPIWLGMSSDWSIAFTIVASQAWPWLLLVPMLWWFTHRVQIDAMNWRRTLPLHALVAVLMVAAYAVLWYQPLHYGWITPPRMPMGPGPMRVGFRSEPGERGPIPTRAEPPPSGMSGSPGEMAGARGLRFQGGGPENMLLRQARGALPVYLVLVAGAHAFLYHRRSVEREQRALRAEAQLSRARLAALQSQLQPHFLFNSLNAASALVYTQPAEADRMLCEIGEFLRAVLAASARPAVALREEIELLEKYTAIQRIRYPHLLTVDFEIDEEVAEAVVPTLILQPLVENAIKHGIGRHGGAGRIDIVARRHGSDLAITVIDQLLGLDGADATDQKATKDAASENAKTRLDEKIPPTPGAAEGFGIGLANIRQRLDVWTGGRFRCDVQALKSPQVGTRVVLMVPLNISLEHV